MEKTSEETIWSGWKRWFFVSALTVAAFVLCSIRAFAAGGLSMSTDYPGMAVKAGDEQTVSLDFVNSGAGVDVSLHVESIPEGWEGYFAGGSAQISRAHIKNGTNEGLVSFRYTVPAEAAEGSYSIVLLAEGNGVSAQLPLTLEVAETMVGASELSAEYPEQEGQNGTSFSFTTTLVNNSTEDQSYSFSTDAPGGWQVGIKPSGETTQVASIEVAAGESQGLSVSVVPPNNAEAGSYPISVSAISAKETLKTELSVNITESYNLGMTTPGGLLSLEAHANKETPVTLKLSNNGNVDLNNITFTSTAPDGWNIRFEESGIDTLAANSTQEVTAYVTPSEDAMAGDYAISLTASAEENAQTLDFRVSVKTETIWGMVGLFVIAAVIGALAYIFHKYGRR